MATMLPARCEYPIDNVYHADALTFLRGMADNSVNCVVTSPPYFGLRDYGTPGQIGLESNPTAFIDTMAKLFHEVRRVLRDDGTCWINMGDSYSGSGKGPSGTTAQCWNTKNGVQAGTRTSSDLGPKNLLGIPWRLVFALQDDGWILRSDIIWHKPNPMPESVTDRPTKSHEYVFLLTKSARYWYDAMAIRETSVSDHDSGNGYAREARQTYKNSDGSARGSDKQWKTTTHRNRRTVWTISTEPTPFAHFATFPTALIEPMILAGSPERVCSVCGNPYERHITKSFVPQPDVSQSRVAFRGKMADENHWKGFPRGTVDIQTLGFRPTCECDAESTPGIVFDPFMGSGTTALVARHLSRHFIGCELNAEYVALARHRLATTDPYQDRPVNATTTQLSLFAQDTRKDGANGTNAV
jgi:DNA modification methylase